MNVRLNIYDLKAILWIPTLMGGIMVGVAWLSNDKALIWAFAGMIIMSLAITLSLRFFREPTQHSCSMGETLATVAFGWTLVILLGAIPFALSGFLIENTVAVDIFRQPLNCLFESVSGFTSTGLSMVKDPSELPSALQFWRSFMEWIGGVGLALLMMTVMNPSTDGGDLFDAELNKNFSSNARQTVKKIWWIYISLTGISIGLFAVLGMPLWESINHGMTAISTGGFTITKESFGAYSQPIQIAAILIMTMGAISFAAYHQLVVKRELISFCRRGPTLFLILGIIVVSLLLWAYRWMFETNEDYTTLVFQAVSAFATAGFTNTSLSDWHSTTLTVLIVCMFIGGASGATTGGVKIDRVLLLLRSIGWRFQRLFKGNIQREIIIDGKSYEIKQARLQAEGVATLVTLWVITGLVGCLVLAPICVEKWTFTQIWFEVMSALGSVGLSTGITSGELPATGKWTLITLMWMGRLELISAFALLLLPFTRK